MVSAVQNTEQIKQQLQQILTEQLGEGAKLNTFEAVYGGNINQAYQLSIGENPSLPNKQPSQLFIKLNHLSQLEMFAAEYAGLQAIRQSGRIRCPKPIAYGASENVSYLLMECITLAPPKAHSQREAGLQLAALHQTLEPKSRFGWHQDNTIGSTHQSNRYHPSWADFWREERLMPQLKLAKKQGMSTRDYEAGLSLCDQLPRFFKRYQPEPSLLHGDLWSGNMGYDASGAPVIFDPACYYGDRETDLAMTELFGGFSEQFYQAYNEAFPIDSGYRQRKALYQLYHILNHYHLFGGNYGQQATRLIKDLLH